MFLTATMPASSIAISKPKMRRIVCRAKVRSSTQSGEVMGQHAGIHRYTIGQRRGIGIAGRTAAVCHQRSTRQRTRSWSDTRTNLLGHEFTAAGVNWIAFDKPELQPVRAEVRVRYRHTPAAGHHHAAR